MSLIHLDKSVLTLHLKEIVEDGHLGEHLILLGLGIMLLSPKLVPSLVKVSRSRIKNLTRRELSVSTSAPISLSEWVAEAQRQQRATQVNHSTHSPLTNR